MEPEVEEIEEQEYLPDDLKVAISALVQAGKTTPQEIIQLGQSYIERTSKINSKQSSRLLLHVSKIVFHQKPVPASKLLLESRKKLSLGCPVIDRLLNGGLLMQCITEVSGESATGKTQFALQSLLQAILPEENGGLGGSGLYLSTEDTPVTRWNQLVEYYAKKYPNTTPDYFHSNMFYCKVYSIQKLTEIIQSKVLPLIRTKNIKLLVIDSIAALFRCEMGSLDQSQEKSWILHQQAAILKQLSDENKIPILIINQVTDYFVNESNAHHQIHSGKAGVVPSLGLHWANSINVRIMLSKTNYTHVEEAPEEQIIVTSPNENPTTGENENGAKQRKKRKLAPVTYGVRQMKVVFAPHLPNASCYYLIDQGGIQGLEMREEI